MHTKLAVVIFATLQPLLLIGDELPRLISNQSDSSITNKISTGEQSPMSDREKAGLRGPIQRCTEERTTPAFENGPATTYTTTTKYSPEGRILQSITSNSLESGPPKFSTTYTYDSAGRLLKKTITVLVRPRPNQNTTTTKKGKSSASPETPFEPRPSNTVRRAAGVA